ncbi:ubiquitin C-terminal hydrolase 13-like isoform X4 [Apium graveolens]|uniref:ubiquitin C-terminal hydrolase 13-like isoform X4 n=1 Tax=Apium graveolens TaxID=4045 RepID=UPI003D7BC5B3
MVGKLREVSSKVNKAELKLFLEVIPALEQCSVLPFGEREGDILLFFKLYHPKKEELRYVGNLFVNCTGKPIEIVRNINELAGFDPDEQIELYEFENGDIICFQRQLQPHCKTKSCRMGEETI